MKKPIFLLMFLVYALVSSSQNVGWAKNAIGSDLDEGNAIAVDANGNTYITGQFESPNLTFGTRTIINSTNADYTNIFVAKMDPLGNCIWARSLGGAENDYGSAIAVDNNGNVFVGGYYKSPIINDVSITINNQGNDDAILAKFDSNGTLLWLKGIGGSYDDRITGISTDQSGDVYITGCFYSSSLNFETGPLASAGNTDIFLAKYSSSGTNLWSKRFGGIEDDRANAIKTDNNGNSYFTGSFQSTSIDFGTGPLINSGGDKNLFVTKVDNLGISIWAKSSTSTAGGIEGSGISIDQIGNAYIGGVFDGSTAVFPSQNLTNVRPNGSNAYLAKYSSSGDFQWANNPTSGPEGNSVYCITSDNVGNSYISGWYTSPSVNFNGISLTSSAFGDNIFLAKYNTSGLIQNAYSFCGSGFSGGYGNGICSDNSGNVFLTGYFEGNNMVFGSNSLTNTAIDTWDVYWTKIGFGLNEIESFKVLNKSNIYPNPFNTSTKIRTDFNMQEAFLIIFNINGEIVFTNNQIQGNEIVLERNNLSKGLYFIQIIDNENIYNSKIFIE